MKFAHHLVEDGEWSDLDEATTMSGGAHGRHRQTRGDGSEKATPVARDRFGRATPAGSNPSRMSLSSRDSKDVTASGASDSADEPLPLRERRADRLCTEDEPRGKKNLKALDAEDSEDDSEDDGESWRDAVVGIKGMAQALRDANNHVSMVALNADLTVSLSTMMLNTLRLFEAAGPAARGARGETARPTRAPTGRTRVSRTSPWTWRTWRTCARSSRTPALWLSLCSTKRRPSCCTTRCLRTRCASWRGTRSRAAFSRSSTAPGRASCAARAG